MRIAAVATLYTTSGYVVNCSVHNFLYTALPAFTAVYKMLYTALPAFTAVYKLFYTAVVEN